MKERHRAGVGGVAAVIAANIAVAATLAASAVAAAAVRVEAHSAGMLAVGIVQHDVMSVHLSRQLDNAPVRNAVLTVLLRGVVHPTLVEADGSYTLRTKDLELPGPAMVQFDVVADGVRDSLKGSIDNAGVVDAAPRQENSVRQLGWWALNFSVCIGFLMLISRRRRSAQKS